MCVRKTENEPFKKPGVRRAAQVREFLEDPGYTSRFTLL